MKAAACYIFLLALGLAVLHSGQILQGSPPVNTKLVLYGKNFVSSSGILLMAAAALGAGFHFLTRRGMDRFSRGVFVLAGIVSLHYIHNSDNEAYTNDWPGHCHYALFFLRHWTEPFGYRGLEGHQPPTFYYLAALVLAGIKMLGTIPLITTLRFISWLSYLAFNVFGLLTLKRAGLSPRAWRLSALLLLLWPGGLHFASKLGNEMFYYACFSAAFYYTVAWYQSGEQRRLVFAVALAGFVFMVKSNGMILFAVIALLMGIAWYRGRLRPREIKPLAYLLLLGWCALAFFITASGVIGSHSPLVALDAANYLNAPPFSIAHYLTINYRYALYYPFIDWTRNQSFWDFLFKTSLFGEYAWPRPMFARLLLFLLHVIVIFATIPWLAAQRRELKGMMPFALGLIISAAALISYVMIRNHPFSQDVRYVYPVLVCFAACFGRGYMIAEERRAVVSVFLANVAVWSFAMLSVYFFWNAQR